jgi:undecaprenyl-diphosphatase
VADFLTQFDIQLFFLINNGLSRPWLDPIFKFMTWLGAWPVGFVALGALAVGGRGTIWKRHFPVLLVGILLFSGINRSIKKTVRAPRPGKVYREQLVEGSLEIHFLEGKVPMRKAFPSGHSMTAFFFMTYLALARRRLALPALILALLIAMSRVYVGAHFPLDCVGGALVGGLGGWMAWRIHQRLFGAGEAVS